MSLIAVIAAIAGSAPGIEAKSFVGEWVCEREATAVSFVWNVRDDRLKGRWLVGEAVLGGEKAAIDIWQYAEDGSPGVRTQFNYSNVMISMTPVSMVGGVLEMAGVLDPDGVNVKIEETIEFISPTEFKAQWRYMDPETSEWLVNSEETCRKAN